MKAATITGAEILGQQGKIGIIQKGAYADILILSHNPIEDLSALNQIEKTIIDGQIAYSKK